jgi:hypothetical protein
MEEDGRHDDDDIGGMKPIITSLSTDASLS